MKVRPTYSNNRQGFTLVEVIVVIAILGILAMLAVPRLSGFSEMAEKENDQMMAEFAINAMEFYCTDNNLYTIEVDTNGLPVNPPAELTYDSVKWKDVLDKRGLWTTQDQSLESTYYTEVTLSLSNDLLLNTRVCTVTLVGEEDYVITN